MITNSIAIGDANIETIRSIQPTSLVFDNTLRISWGNHKLDVDIAEGVEVSKAAKEFFDYLKIYIYSRYDIVEKENV